MKHAGTPSCQARSRMPPSLLQVTDAPDLWQPIFLFQRFRREMIGQNLAIALSLPTGAPLMPLQIQKDQAAAAIRKEPANSVNCQLPA
ncbi:hypothetical protein [Pseudogemmobacter bohemicus]|uniref:hypothetical protein n=1 Tax=Pseudogemmobacter bohemicus TaxID=2250708 RepID=UPI00130056F7|nr:hypothetical protein [Pseudogemmobacter bohemicus]